MRAKSVLCTSPERAQSCPRHGEARSARQQRRRRAPAATSRPYAEVLLAMRTETQRWVAAHLGVADDVPARLKTKTERWSTSPRKTTQRRVLPSGARCRPSPRTCTAGKGQDEMQAATREAWQREENDGPSNCSPESARTAEQGRGEGLTPAAARGKIAGNGTLGGSRLGATRLL